MWKNIAKQFKLEWNGYSKSKDGMTASRIPLVVLVGTTVFSVVAMVLFVDNVRIVGSILLATMVVNQIMLDIYKGPKLLWIGASSRLLGLIIGLAGIWYGWNLQIH